MIKLNIALVTIGLIPTNEASMLIKAFKRGTYSVFIYRQYKPIDVKYLYTEDNREFYYCQDRLFFRVTLNHFWYEILSVQ